MGQGRSKRIRKAIERMQALDASAGDEVLAAIGAARFPASGFGNAGDAAVEPDESLVDAIACAGVESSMVHAPPDFVVGGVQPLRRLAEGPLGTTHLAREVAAAEDGADRFVTLLVMRPPAAPEARERFRLVVRGFAALRHPALPRVLALGTTDGDLAYATFELLPTRSFLELADACGLSIDARLRAFVEICEAVEEARLEGWLLGGLRPEEVVAAPPAAAGGRLRPVIGTIERAAPARAIERARHAHLAPGAPAGWFARTPGDDVAGLAGLLHELLVGRPPGPGGSAGPEGPAGPGMPGTDGSSAAGAGATPLLASERLAFMFRGGAREVARRRGTRPFVLGRRLRRGLDEVIRRGLAAGGHAAGTADAWPDAGALAAAVRRHLRG